MRHDIPLTALRLEWLPRGKLAFPDGMRGGHRYQMGVSLHCPFHGTAHGNVELWFREPLDGGPPVLAPQLYMLEGYPFEEMSIYPAGDDTSPIDLGCGPFWIAGGTCLFHTD